MTWFASFNRSPKFSDEYERGMANDITYHLGRDEPSCWILLLQHLRQGMVSIAHPAPFPRASVSRPSPPGGYALLTTPRPWSTEAMTSKAAASPSLGLGSWVAGRTTGPGGVRRYYLYVPPELTPREGARPLVVMLHGCGQKALDFARSTRKNLLAARERFFVLYLEQDKLSNPKGCWNWHERCSGIADAEAATVMNAIDDICRKYPIDRDGTAVAGLSAGASMAALVATRYPRRFKAVAMHSGVAPGAAMSGITALAAMRGLHAPPIVLTLSARPWEQQLSARRCHP
jgi:poly(hydroxyalkanoate) depolymerase family esterase